MKTLSIIMLFVASSSFAGQRPKQTLSWDDFLKAAQSPGDYVNQEAQSGIKIKCNFTETKWFPTTSEKIEVLQGSSNVSASVTSNKYDVTNYAPLYQVANETSYACPVYYEATRSITDLVIDVDLTVVTASTFNLNAFCKEATAKAVSSVEWKKTGREDRPCEQKAQSQSQTAPAQTKSRWSGSKNN